MLVAEEQLLTMLNYKRRGDLKRCLDSNHIPYFLGRDGKIVTTIQAINSVLIDNKVKEHNESVKFI